jgi:hypothetical protein
MLDAPTWVEKFTGLKFDTGEAAPLDANGYEEITGLKLEKGAQPPKDLAAAGETSDLEAAMKKTLLGEARKALAVVKKDFQGAMSNEVKVQGAFFKQAMLDVEGTQMDEAEFEDIDFTKLKLSTETQQAIGRGTNVITNENERLKAATIERNGKVEPLFTNQELEDEFWFPLTRERILPETFTSVLYSKTQKMIDQTNALYNNAVADKKKAGQLTADFDFVHASIEMASDLTALGGSMAGAFGPGSANAKLAGEILTMMSGALSSSNDVYDALKAKKYADATTSAIGVLDTLAAFALGQAGVSKQDISFVNLGASVAQSAIKIGQKLADGPKGVTSALDIFSDALSTALTTAAGAVSDPQTKEALLYAAAAGPGVLKQVAIGADLVGKARDGDTAGVIDCLTKSANAFLSTATSIEKTAKTDGGTSKDSTKVSTEIDTDTKAGTQLITVAGQAIKATVAVAIALKQGDYYKSVNAIIQNISNELTAALVTAGLDRETAAQVGKMYHSLTDSSKVIKAISADPPKIKEALAAFGEGVGKAMEGAAPGNTALKTAGAEVSKAISTLTDGADAIKLYKEGKCQEGAELFLATADKKLKSIFNFKSKAKTDDDDEDEEEDETEGQEPKKEEGGEQEAPESANVKNALGSLLVAAGNSKEALKKGAATKKKQEAVEEADLIIAHGKEKLAAVSKEEQAGIDASDIDVLIMEMVRDKAITNIALMIVSGGTAFLATFVPGLGAVSAGIKMAANMVAAAQRAQQLGRWVNSQRDFAAAQNALTSSAQNFVKNQADQFAHHTIQATFQAAQMIGDIVKVGGISAAAGQGLQTAGQIGEQLENIIQKWKKRAEVEYAWRITKKSLKNPTNRKLALKARAINPTLAKYSIAWGAVHMRDPLARNALTACNLTEAVLNNEKANVDKVVSYLEKFYDEDDTLYRELEKDVAWCPPDKVTLDLRCWGKIKKLAVENIKLSNPDTGMLDSQLTLLKVDIEKLDASGVTERIELLMSIKQSFTSYKPVTNPTSKAEDLNKVIKILVKQVDDKLKAAKKRGEAWADGTLAKEEEDAQKLRAERLENLKTANTAIAELNNQLTALNSLDLDDSISDVEELKTAAAALLEDVGKTRELRENGDVQNLVKTVRAKIKALDNLIKQLKAAGLN